MTNDYIDAFLAQTDILINVLPLTSETAGLLSAPLFAKLPNTALVDLSPDNALDIDTLADLERAKGLTHA